MASNYHDVDLLCVNTIRTLSIDAVQNANSGHPGMPLGAAPLAYVLWARYLKHDPTHPDWPNRDRFVLSGGHGSMLLYSLLHLSGYDVSLDDLRQFRQWGSRTPGHPESFITPGVEATTGPLGQGSANAVGMAMAERHLAARFNVGEHELIDHYTYALVTDGDLMEGISAEASSLAGHLGLGKLIYLYDANDVSLDGPLELTFTEDVGRRYEAYGWQVIHVEDGDHDPDAIDLALDAAKEDTTRPSLIVVKTTIGYGSPAKSGSSDAHGAPLGAEEVRAVKEGLGFDPDEHFHVPDAVREHFKESGDYGAQERKQWEEVLAYTRETNPELSQAWDEAWSLRPPEGWDAELPSFEIGSKIATRSAGGAVLNALADKIPFLMGGDADLGCSTKTTLNGEESFDGESGAGRNIHFGVREHAMAAIANGMCYHGGVRPFVSTFFCFSDYMRPSMRLAALSGLPSIFVFTHDSIGVGEDGPTHQPVEHLMSLRVMPNLAVLRPGDANETEQAWKWIIEQRDRPAALVLSRQNLPVFEETLEKGAEGLRRGAYVVSDPADAVGILIATGSELSLAMEAHHQLADEGTPVRVVSMPCWELFAEQDADYQEKVLPARLPLRLSIEAGVSLGWERWIGSKGRSIAMDRFGASAPGDVLFERFGFKPQTVVQAVHEMLQAG